MTEPAQASRARGGMRTYHWPPQPPHDLEVVSVTSIISGGIPKPFLAPWSAKMVAEYAVDHLESWQALAKSDPKGAVDLLKRSVWRSTSEKADMGTIVHAAAEAFVKGKPMTEDELTALLTERRVPLERWRATRGYVNGALEFMSDVEPEVYLSEATVYNRTHGYAGTGDILGRVRIGKSKRPAVVDFKTSKAIYDEVSLQLCAYSRAEFVGLDDGTELPMPWDGEPCRDGVAVRLTPSGSYEVVHFHLTDDLFSVFLGAQTVALGGAIIKAARGRGL